MKKLLLIGLGFFIVLVGCDLVSRDFYRAEDDFPENGKGLLVLVLDGSAIPTKTIAPSGMDIEYYHIIGYRGGVEEFNVNPLVTSLVSGVYTQNGLTPDYPAATWTVDVFAHNASTTLIGSGATASAFTIEANTITDIVIPVLPEAGDGILSLTIPWPTGSVVNPAITANLIAAAGGSVPIGTGDYDGFDPSTGFIIAGDQATYNDTTIEAGYYTLELQLLGDDTNGDPQPVWGEAVSIRIIYTQLTEGIWDPININATGGVGIAFEDMKNPFGITLPTPAATSSSISATATLVTAEIPDDPPPTSYNYVWYIDGLQVANNPSADTNNTLDITSGLTLSDGNHNLSVVVTAHFSDGIDIVSSVTQPFTLP